MTREQLDAIRARVEAATPGPWDAGRAYCCPDMGWIDGPKRMVCPVHESAKRTHTLDANDAEFIASAREDVPTLLAEVERLRDAHAMAVQVSGELCEKCGWAMKFPGEKCRCELLAEVERLNEFCAAQNATMIDALCAETEAKAKVERLTAERAAAFQRGVAAMRVAAVVASRENVGCRHVLCHSCASPASVIRALPDPEDKS